MAEGLICSVHVSVSVVARGRESSRAVCPPLTLACPFPDQSCELPPVANGSETETVVAVERSEERRVGKEGSERRSTAAVKQDPTMLIIEARVWGASETSSPASVGRQQVADG